MSTLPANSTFLPVLDDLLSPDFRVPSIPGQTPQTPAETPVSATAPKTLTFLESHTGQLTAKTSNYPGVKDKDATLFGKNAGPRNAEASSSSSASSQSHSNGVGVKSRFGAGHQHHRSGGHGHNHQTAALKIQQWWKKRQGKRHFDGGSNGPLDPRAERAKHTIRHNRTDDHVRYLETEVQRLKSALATERKLRSLQVEAIRSLWSQVQKVTSSPGGDNGIMSHSMPNPNFQPDFQSNKDASSGSCCMSMSLHSTLSQNQKQNQLNQTKSEMELACSCTKEIQTLKESFTTEMVNLREMIDQLKVSGGCSKNIMTDSISEDANVSQNQKRPLTLNLSGGSGRASTSSTTASKEEGSAEVVSGYALDMATSIIDHAKDN